MNRTPARAALAVGVALVAVPPALLATGGTAFPAISSVVAGALALYGVLLALAGWFGLRTADGRRPLWALSLVGAVLLAVPLAGVGVGLLAWAMVAGLAALLGPLPAVAVLFRATRRPPG